MPYELFKQDKKWCVRNQQTGESKGCSDTRKMAVQHMRALYVHEGKKETEVDVLVEKALSDFRADNPNEVEEDETLENKDYDSVYPSSYYYGATSFDELDSIQENQDKAMDVNMITNQYGSLLSNIIASSMMEDKEKLDAISALGDEYKTRIGDRLASADGEDKELDDFDEEEEGLATKAKWTTAHKNDLPDSAFLYVEPGCKVKSCRHFPYKGPDGKIDLPHLRNAIARIPQSNAPGLTSAKKAALQARARKMLESANKEVNEQSFILKVVQVVKEVLNIKEQPTVEDQSSMMFFKEDGGQYAWIARYSNNFRDVDEPPEIISADSHKRFVERVEKGLEPLPELWLWHLPQWKFGHATWVAYDDSGFALAGGVVDKDKEGVAEWLSKQDNILVSHGMPPLSIKRDDSDPSIIIEHATREISPLPSWAAANKLTGFIVLDENNKEKQEDNEMPIPAKKREALIKQWGVNPSLLDALEQANEADAQKAQAEGVESKEVEASTQAEAPAKTEATAAAPAKEEAAQTTPVSGGNEDGKDKTSQPVAPENQYPTRQEVVEAFANVVSPFVESTTTTLQALAARMEQLAGELKELKEADETKVTKQALGTPAASLLAMFQAQSTIGNKKTEVDGRTSLAKSKPKETPSHQTGSTGIPFLDAMLTPKE